MAVEILKDEVEETQEPELEEEVEVEEVEPEDEAGDEVEDEPGAPEQTKEESVPLSKYMQERKKRQEYEKLIAEQTSERERLTMVQDLMNRGWPEAEAQAQSYEKTLQRRELDELKSRQLDFDIRDLATSDEFYSDALSFKDDIKDKMRTLKINAEEAYMLVRGKNRTRELQMLNEQRAAAKRGKTQAKKVENGKPTKLTSSYKLDDNDNKALATLQKMQPNAGWTIKKYYEMMKQ